MSSKPQILEMLCQGLSPVQVSTTLGVSESYISQLLDDEDFKVELEEKKVAAAQEDIEYDNQIDRVEGTFLDRIESKAPLANLQQSLQAFSVLNKAKRRKDSAIIRSAPQAGTIVNLQLNINLIPQYLTNGKNEIVEVEGKSMISASPRKLDEILKIRAGETGQQIKPALPGVTKVERAAGVLQSIDNRPQRKLPKLIPHDLEMSDLL
jgi:hypothetical protein